MKHYTLNKVSTLKAGKYYDAARAKGGNCKISKCDRNSECRVDIWCRDIRDVLNHVRAS